MTDAGTARRDFHEKAAIHHAITQQNLEQLLGIIIQVIQVGENVESPETQFPKIYPEWLSIEFVRERSSNGVTPAGFYIDPRLQKRAEKTPENILTLTDVTDIFKSIAKENPVDHSDSYIETKIKEHEYADVSVLNEAQLELYNRIKGDEQGELLRRDVNFLRADSRNLLSIIATLHGNAGTQAEVVETVAAFPDEFTTLIADELNLGVSWEWVKPLIDDVVTTPLDSELVFFRYDNKRIAVRVVAVRFFLNTWLKKLYEQYSERFREKGLDLPDTKLFDATNKSPAYFDLEYWVELDEQVARFIQKDLAPIIEQFLRSAPAAAVGLSYQKKDTEEEEKKEQLTKDLKKPEDVDDLLKRFDEAGKSYRDETNRLTTILLPQMFRMHGVIRDLGELEQIDRADFINIEREFRSELENVLRSLTPAEFALLNQRGASLEFRLIVLRKLYGKLSTNPRFVGSLQGFKENYVEFVQKQVDEKKAPQRELDDLERYVNLPDSAFDDRLQSEQSRERDWAKLSTTSTSTVSLKNYINLHEITQTDFQFILLRLTDDTFDRETLLRNLDVLIAERWSLDQLRNLRADQAAAVFGMALPESLLRDEARYHLFLQLCTEYLYARRQRLANHYQLDAISRDSGKDGDLASLAEAQATAERFKDYGGGEALIVARASDSKRVQEYNNGHHTLAVGITAIHNETKQSRKDKVEQNNKETKERFHDMSIDDKRALLSSLGVLTLDLDADNIDETAKLLAINQRFEAAMAEDYADGISSLDNLSYFEDQDDGFVQEGGEEGQTRRGVPHRFGRPGGRSLMKGALNLRKKYNTAKTRIQQAKKAAKAAGKAFEAVESVLTAPIPIKNKWAKRGILAVGAALFVDFLNTIQSGIGAQIGAGVGAFAGGVVTFFTGGSGFFIIPATTYLGAKIGQAAQFGIEGIFGGRPEVGYNGPGLSSFTPTVATSPAAGTVMAAKAGIDSAVANAKASAAGLTGSLPSAIATAASGTYLGVTLLVATVITASLQPPPLSTIGSSGLESQYVAIRKEVNGPTSYGDVVPSNLNYTISIEAKGDYEIEIINFQDDFTVTPNEELNTENPPDLNCENNLNIDSLQTRVLRPEDGEILIGDCPVTLNQSYHDTSIINKFTVQFRVRLNGEEITNESPDPSCGENENTFCAISGAAVCIGECPAQTEGCWPTTGTLTQGPHDTFSHSLVDAFDIGAPLGREVYATFDGTAWAFDTFSAEPSQQGLVMPGAQSPKIYGKHVILVTNQGFVLLYGHLSRHGSTLQLGQPIPVTAGTLVGYVGNSGSTPQFTMGNHLHYEYRIPAGGGWKSNSVRAPNDPLSKIVPGDAPGQDFVYTKGKAVTTCYSPTE